MKHFRIGPDLREQIRKQACVALPRECCGLIEGIRMGDTVSATTLHPTRNTASETDRFEIDPAAHISILRAAGAEARKSSAVIILTRTGTRCRQLGILKTSARRDSSGSFSRWRGGRRESLPLLSSVREDLFRSRMARHEACMLDPTRQRTL